MSRESLDLVDRSYEPMSEEGKTFDPKGLGDHKLA